MTEKKQMRIMFSFIYRNGLYLTLIFVISIFALPLAAQNSDVTDDEVSKVINALNES